MMRGIVRLSAIGLAIGLMSAAAVPTAATAATPIHVDKSGPFPHSVHDDAMLKKKDRKKFDKDHGFKPFGQFVRKKVPHGPPDPIPFGQKVRKLVPPGPPKPFKKKRDRDRDGKDHANHVSTIPEPATWIMMIAGFGVVAWRLRNRGQHGFGSIPAHA